MPVLLALVLTTAWLSTAIAEERQDGAGRPEARHPSGVFSHGEGSSFTEEFYGGRVEPLISPVETPTRKHDPAIRWDALVRSC